VHDYILRRAFTVSTSASSSIVVIYDLGLGTVYDWFVNMHDASTHETCSISDALTRVDARSEKAHIEKQCVPLNSRRRASARVDAREKAP